MKTQNGKTVNRIGGLRVLLILFFSLRNVKGNATVVEEYGWIFFHAKNQKVSNGLLEVVDVDVVNNFFVAMLF